MGRSAVPLLLLSAALAACTVPQPAEQVSAVVAAPSAEVAGRIEAFLRERGFVAVGGGDAGPVAGRAGLGAIRSDWYRCDPVLYSDRYATENPRLGWAEPTIQGGEVAVRLEPVADGTRVVPSARYDAVVVNTFSNTAQAASCATTGGLERAIIAAASGA
jgi:hypothetical protein